MHGPYEGFMKALWRFYEGFMKAYARGGKG